MFELDNFLWCVKLETGSLAVAWCTYVISEFVFWLSLFGLTYDIFAFALGHGKMRLFVTFIITIAWSGILKFIYKKFIDEIEKRDRSIVIGPIIHGLVSIFSAVPSSVILLFVLGVTSDAVFAFVIVLTEIVNVYCLLVFWSLYRKFQHGEPLTNEV